MEPELVLLADGPDLVELVEGAGRGRAEGRDDAARHEAGLQVLLDLLQEGRAPEPALVVDLEQPHRHRAQTAALLHA